MSDMIRLIEPLVPGLRRYARALLRDQPAADDLVQDCLERVISRWHQRRDTGDARAWAFTILHNLAINRLRQKARRGRHVTLEDAESALPSTPSTQETGLRHRDLLRGLAALSEEHRAVLLLIAVEELSYAEAARVLDIPVGTVMSRLARARERLMKMMEGENIVQLSSARQPALRRLK